MAPVKGCILFLCSELYAVVIPQRVNRHKRIWHYLIGYPQMARFSVGIAQEVSGGGCEVFRAVNSPFNLQKATSALQNIIGRGNVAKPVTVFADYGAGACHIYGFRLAAPADVWQPQYGGKSSAVRTVRCVSIRIAHLPEHGDGICCGRSETIYAPYISRTVAATGHKRQSH